MTAYEVERCSLRWRVVSIGDDGAVRPCGSLRFWRLMTALRFASELQHAWFVGSSSQRTTGLEAPADTSAEVP